MIVEKLELVNFLSHKNSTVTFGKGLTAIVGPNGAGKSSMIEGIIFSLFQDSFRTLRSGTKESLKQIGAKSALVRLTFNVAGRRFRVERVIEKGAVDKLYEEDKLIATQASYVDKKVLEVLGVPRKEAYLNTVIVRQGELEKVLESFMTASGREELMRALGFKELEDMAETLKEERSEFEKEYMKLLGEATQLENLKKQLEKVQEEMRRFESEKNKLLENLKVLEKGLLYVEKALTEVPESLEREFETITAKYYKTKSELESLIREAKKVEEELNRLGALKKELINLNSTLVLKEEIQILQDKLERALLAHSKLEELESAIRRLEEKLMHKLRIMSQKLQCPTNVETVVEAYNKLKADVEVKEGLVNSLKVSMEEKRAMLNSLNKSGDVCPLCGTKLTSEIRLRVQEKLESELNETASRFNSLLESLKREKEMLDAIEKLNVAGLMDELMALNEEKRRREEEKRAYLEHVMEAKKVLERIMANKISDEVALKVREISKLINTPLETIRLVRQVAELITKAEGRLEELKRISIDEENMKAEMQRLISRREELQDLVVNLERRMEELRRKLELRKKLLEESNKIKAQIAEQRGRLLGIEESINGYKKRLEELKELCKKAEDAEREASKIRNFIDFVDFLRNTVFGKDGLVAKQLRKAYRAKLESEVNDYLSRFGMDFEVEFDEDLRLKVISRSEELSVDSLSGGERAVLALSARLALAKALSSREVELLILDEPTANLDADRRRELVRVLRDLADEIPQVIVVTHDHEVAEAADQIYKVRKDNGVSIVEEY
ncbi:MAG: SMC family ATPase [Candidatus Nezhaarchaeales archaeon]